MAPRVLICGDLVWAHQECAQMFEGIGEVIVMDSTDRKSFLADLKPNGKYSGIVGCYRHNISADKIGIFDREIIQHLSSTGMKWIAHNGAGYDQIDVIACKDFGIVVSNTPGAVDDATATTALYLLISTLRQFSWAERSARSGTWKNPLSSRNAHDLTGHTLAILGLGGIGLRLAYLVHAFPMRVIYHNRNRVQDAPDWIEFYEGKDGLDRLLKEADVLSVHVPLRDDTEGMVGEEMIRKLRKGAVIINTARGKVIDEEALIRALEDGHLAAAGLDVYPSEPSINPKLLTFNNVILLPHMGTETRDSQKKMEIRALANLRDYLVKGIGSDVVPELRGAKL
ncbi:D-isomer specific 2-hydroxyacid dehydrogenase [Abortiporus biennis]|nr:D-isomer specific 2-hydroxyacid dehydrogenase [Abortiporus biennis]